MNKKEQTPALHLTGDITVEKLAQLYERLTGRAPTEQELAEMRAKLAEAKVHD